MNKFKVVATTVTFGKFNNAPVERLIKAGCEVTTNKKGRPFTEKEIIQESKGADALIVGTDKITNNVINNLDNSVKIIAKHGVGFDSIDLESARKRNIFVTNVPGANSNEVADLAIGFLISLARNIPIGNKEVREGIWNKRAGISMKNKTIGVIGTGAIGSEVIKRTIGFGMKVLAYDLVENSEVVELGAEYVDKETLLKDSDFITLHVPDTSETHHFIGKNELELMKENALIVNSARAGLVDYTALDKALTEGRIMGYATDDFEQEPTPYLNIFEHENVVVTPHIGATTIDANLTMGNGAVDCVLAIKNDKRPPEKNIRNGM
ncbi:2-hydroxyacid dehydrogenase [Tetragenococcus halophilus subsp. flandriensis]|uniref:phosphoglycerate dehydrogenase n=1 Tax=Tetragenococcus halophilus TaxID=51669 RepID=UPI0023E92760|nr:phosphoglycerate dehydrogenase [Tetragenococcus halophilus]GMA08451.1 2-hydroxyacid dehydrogenase [Tetragenococcus halophilus subsp. flandriensis]